MAKANPLLSVWLLVVNPARFVEVATRHDIELEFERNPQLLAAYPNRELPADRIKEFENSAWDRTRKIRGAFGVAIWWTVAAILLGYVVGFGLAACLGKPAPWLVSALQIGGAGVILAATLAVLGWEIQSYKGVSLPENVNRWLFRFQYGFGTFLFVLSVAWNA